MVSNSYGKAMVNFLGGTVLFCLLFDYYRAMVRIFVVEDNDLIRDGIKEYFEVSSYEVDAFSEISQTREALQHHRPEVIILDVMLPDGNGFVFAKEIRNRHNVPIIFLTAKEDVSDRIMGFEVGGDDYVVKPFSNKELLLRVEALLKRSGEGISLQEQDQVQKWMIGSSTLSIDKKAIKVVVDGIEVSLTSSEWSLLVYLAERPEQVLSRDTLLGECLDYMYSGSERTVDTHIANLRNNLGSSKWIKTVRGFGYRFGGEPVTEDHKD